MSGARLSPLARVRIRLNWFLAGQLSDPPPISQVQPSKLGARSWMAAGACVQAEISVPMFPFCLLVVLCRRTESRCLSAASERRAHMQQLDVVSRDDVCGKHVVRLGKQQLCESNSDRAHGHAFTDSSLNSGSFWPPIELTYRSLCSICRLRLLFSPREKLLSSPTTSLSQTITIISELTNLSRATRLSHLVAGLSRLQQPHSSYGNEISDDHLSSQLFY